MDARIKKTQKAIKTAFIELRKHNSLEKIRIKDLCAMASINKSTFYLHYNDVFHLSSEFEKEVVSEIVAEVASDLSLSMQNPLGLTQALCKACLSHKEIIEILYLDKERSQFVNHLEEQMKNFLIKRNPEYEGDIEKGIIFDDEVNQYVN